MRLKDADSLGEKFDRQMYYLMYEVSKEDNPSWYQQSYAINWCRNTLNDEPTVEAEPVRHGHWNKIGNVWECSECGETISIRKYEEYRMNYCSNCGTKMNKEEE